MKKVLALLLAMFLVLASGCTGKSTTGSTSDSTSGTTPAQPNADGEKKPYIAVISAGYQHLFWQAVRQGVEQAAKDFDIEVTFEAPETETQMDKQIEMIEAAFQRSPVAVCIAPLDKEAVKPILDQSVEMNIPVVSFDTFVEGDIPATKVFTDNEAAAAEAARKLADAIGGEGEVGLIGINQTGYFSIIRNDVFCETIEKEFPNITIVDKQFGDGDPLKSTEIAKNMITAHPNLKGIFCTNEGSTLGGINGVVEMGKSGKIAIIGWDCNKLIKDAARNGTLTGAIAQDPVNIGYKTVEYAFRAANGEDVPKVVNTDYVYFDKTNVDDPDLASMLYD